MRSTANSHSKREVLAVNCELRTKEREMGLKTMLLFCFLVWSFTSVALIMVNSFSVDFYQETCPDVEAIIKDVFVKKMSEQPTPITTIPGTLRLFFHDCFVEGCDGSVLITTTDPNKKAERDYFINLSLTGDAFDIVVRSKKVLEAKCPRTVSCSDILAILARDAVVMANGPHWDVEKGRRDGLVSLESRAEADLPHPIANLSSHIELFKSKGLSISDLVALSGAHTIGFSHCASFKIRFDTNDSTMDPALMKKLIDGCPFPIFNPDVVFPLDNQTPNDFDNLYFKNLQNQMGLLASDQILHSGLVGGVGDITRELVSRYSEDPDLFFKDFAIAMQKLGRVGIKTANEGEIRLDCTRFNE